MEYNSVLIEDTKWSVLVKDTGALAADMGKLLSSLGNGSQGSDQDSQAEAPGLVEDLVLVEGTSMSVEAPIIQKSSQTWLQQWLPSQTRSQFPI